MFLPSTTAAVYSFDFVSLLSALPSLFNLKIKLLKICSKTACLLGLFRFRWALGQVLLTVMMPLMMSALMVLIQSTFPIPGFVLSTKHFCLQQKLLKSFAFVGLTKT